MPVDERNSLLSFYSAWFEQHTDDMRSRIPADTQGAQDEFDLKRIHTRFVQERCEDIAHWLGLTGRAFAVASLSGLFHDLGRFEQAVRFGTMDDRITGSHADMSEQVFWRDVPRARLTEPESELLAAVIRYHNLFMLPDGLPDDILLYARLIRDADKLDIFRYVLDMRNQQERRVFRHINMAEQGEYKQSLMEALLRGENLDAAQVQTQKDRRLLEISLIFDLNFGISFQQTLAMGFVEQQIGGVPDNEKLAAVTGFTLDYMRERVEQR